MRLVPVTVKIPANLRQQLKRSAKRNERKIHAEFAVVLSRGLRQRVRALVKE